MAAAADERERADGAPWPRDPDGAPLYPGTCRTLPGAEVHRRVADGVPHAWRIDMRAALAHAPGAYAYGRFDRDGRTSSVRARPERWGDAVIVRKDIPTSYHLSVVVDDAVQGVTCVVRGTDLEAATDLHVLLQRLLELPSPLYHHHGLIRDPAGDKLAKSAGSVSLAELRAAGVSAADVREGLGFTGPRFHPRAP